MMSSWSPKQWSYTDVGRGQRWCQISTHYCWIPWLRYQGFKWNMLHCYTLNQRSVPNLKNTWTLLCRPCCPNLSVSEKLSLEEDLVQPSNNWIIVMRLKCWEELNRFHMFFFIPTAAICPSDQSQDGSWSLLALLLEFWCKWAGLKAALLNHNWILWLALNF